MFWRETPNVCAIAMALANFERDNSIDPGDVISRGYCTASSPYINTWKDFKKVDKNLYGKIAEEVIENKRAVIVFVPKSVNADSHFVTVCGFRGTLPLDPDGYVYYSCATPDMIKIQDPWKGQCSTLEELEEQRTYATAIRIKR